MTGELRDGLFFGAGLTVGLLLHGVQGLAPASALGASMGGTPVPPLSHLPKRALLPVAWQADGLNIIHPADPLHFVLTLQELPLPQSRVNLNLTPELIA
jgi:hypothetical protein